MPEDGLSDDKKPFKCFTPQGSSLKVFSPPEILLILSLPEYLRSLISAPQLLVIKSLCFIYLFAPPFSHFTAFLCFQLTQSRGSGGKCDALGLVRKTVSDCLQISLTRALQLPQCFEQSKREALVKWANVKVMLLFMLANDFFFFGISKSRAAGNGTVQI